MSEKIDDDEPVPLAIAAKLFFHGHLTTSALRTEARKGNLEIVRIANKDFVTRSAVKRMIEKCTVAAHAGKSSEPLSTITAQEALRQRLVINR